MKTSLLYLKVPSPVTNQATVLAIGTDEVGQYLILDSTCIHIKGGGQHADLGKINESPVSEVAIDNAVVKHYTDVSRFQIGDKVLVSVDVPFRKLNQVYHTSGHVLGDVIEYVLKEPVTHAIDCHYPEGAFISYNEPLKATVSELQQAYDSYVNDLVKQNTVVKSSISTEIHANGKPSRTVTIGSYTCPCGGTHTAELDRISALKVSKITYKRGRSKVHYQLS